MKNGIILCLISLSLWLIYDHFQMHRELTKNELTVSDFTAKQALLDAAPSLDLQLRCGVAAKAFFIRAGYKDDDGDFMNHYNAKLRKCFIVIRTGKWDTSTQTTLTSKNVYDAVEGKTYGQYLWKSDKVKKWWEVSPIICSGINPDGNAITCKDEGEYENLMSIYMDIGD